MELTLRPLFLASFTLLVACPGDVETDLTRYETCGDPVCVGYAGPFPGVPACTTEMAGDACTVDGEECDLQN
ncbi:MAG: hypothetical protein AAF211_01020, partial [Myxococcota bacterium]